MNTTYFLNLAAGNLFKTQEEPAIPDELWIGLSTTTPNINGSGVTEPSGSAGYARVRLDMLSSPNAGVVTNQSNIDFNESTASWGTVTHFVIFDAQNEGHLLQYGSLSTPRTVEAATIMTIKSNYLNLSVQNPT